MFHKNFISLPQVASSSSIINRAQWWHKIFLKRRHYSFFAHPILFSPFSEIKYINQNTVYSFIQPRTTSSGESADNAPASASASESASDTATGTTAVITTPSKTPVFTLKTREPSPSRNHANAIPTILAGEGLPSSMYVAQRPSESNAQGTMNYRKIQLSHGIFGLFDAIMKYGSR
jgi:hypothetical protein